MALKQMINRIGYGTDDPVPLLAPAAIQLKSAPKTTDHAEYGQIAITSSNAYIAGLTTANSTTWFMVGGGGGTGNFASLTVTPGPTSITGVTNINTTGTATTTIGNIGGATNVLINSGTAGTQVSSTGEIDLASSAATAHAISFTATNTNGGILVTTGATLGATSGLNLVQGAATALIQVGAGVPSHTAAQGSLYLNTTGSSTSTRAYISEGGGTWTALTTAA